MLMQCQCQCHPQFELMRACMESNPEVFAPLLSPMEEKAEEAQAEGGAQGAQGAQGGGKR